MAELFPIRSDADHARALKEIAAYWDAAEGSEDEAYMDALATLVDAFERRNYPIPSLSPLEMLKFMMEQNGRGQSDLADLIGSRSRASEILSGKRNLTLDQIRLLHVKWRIPTDLLIGEPAPA